VNTPSGPSAGVQGITELDIANYLANTPGFFERHAELLSAIQITSPHGQRAVSLQERQMEMLRERIKGLVEMIRNGQDNVAIADRLHRWIRTILLTADAAELPLAMVAELKRQFLIPQAAIRLWGVDERYADASFCDPVSDDAKRLAASLVLPYCGVNSGGEAAGWLEDASTVMSLALIPLRQGGADGSFGLLVLGSPDPTRYGADMGTEFLMRIGEVASASLARLQR
jgi:uncharacterized protein YigA (DUF484 family)